MTGRRGKPPEGDTDDRPQSKQPSPLGTSLEPTDMNMNNRNFVRGLCLMAIALMFGLIAATHYSVGALSRSGPGLFPVAISSFLFLIGLITTVRSHFVEPVPLNYNIKNIAVILLGLCGFVVISQYINMIIAIIFMVFVCTFAGTSYSVVRNVKISLGLIAVAFAFKHLLGLSLPLY